jgi:hypothetical protein
MNLRIADPPDPSPAADLRAVFQRFVDATKPEFAEREWHDAHPLIFHGDSEKLTAACKHPYSSIACAAGLEFRFYGRE